MSNRGRRKFVLRMPRGRLVLGERTMVMGVLNVTPDSFSDGGKFFSPQQAIQQALEMQRAGADILDIGGESARPGARGVTAEEEWRRLEPVFRGLSGKLKIPVSIDTVKTEVAEKALQVGARIINDISGLRIDAGLATLAKKKRVPLILMHIRGTPRDMQQRPFAKNIWRSLESGLQWSVRQALRAGVKRSQLVIDPGIGFGKTAAQNLEILRGLRRLEKFRLPVLIGTSRKTFVGTVLDGAPASERLWGTAATVTAAILNGAHIVRVHDVKEMVQVVRLSDAVLHAGRPRTYLSF